MPSIRDISVHVTDSQDVQLEEWGVQHLRTHTKQDKVSAYIKATTGISFRIMIEAKIPYTDYSSEDAAVAGMEDLEEYRGFHPRRAQGYVRPFSRRSHGRRRSQDLSSYRNRDSGFDHGYRPSTTPHRPPFDLLATLYLDGREKDERKVIVYLDPDYEDFKPGTRHQTSRSIIKSRWVQGHDGMIHEHAWVFKDIGIETILDKMALTSEADSMAVNEEDAVIDALSRTGIHHEDDMTREEKHRVGQIEVAITRIVLGRKRVDSDFRPKHREGEDEDVGMGKMKSEVTHTAAFAPLRTLSRRGDVPVISYEPYDDDDEGPFAVFKFFYRSQETLEKFNFPGFIPSGKKPVRSKQVNTNLNHITPLGISRGFTSTSKSKRVEVKAFEDMIEQGGFKIIPAPHFNFDKQNRRLLSADAQESSQLDNSPSSDDSTRLAQLTASNAEVDGRRRSLRSSTRPKITFRFRDPRVNTEQTLLPQPSTESDTARATNEWHDTSIDSSSTVGGYQGAPVNNHSVNESGTSFLPRKARSLTVTNDTLRNEISSDADDEQDPASDLETLAGGDDNDDDGQNMDKDDEGLHKDMKEHLKLGKRARGSDGSSPEDEETATKHYNTEEEHSLAEDNGKKKRIRRDRDVTHKLTRPDSVK